MNRLRLLPAGCALLLASSSPLAQADAPLTVSGTVVAELTGLPLANVSVEINTNPVRQAVTDSSGHYRFEGLDYREYVLSARAIGYIREERTILPGCSVTVTDQQGKILTPGRCTDPQETLRFYLRPHIRFGT